MKDFLKEKNDINDILVEHVNLITDLMIRVSSLEKVLIETDVIKRESLQSITKDINKGVNSSLLNLIKNFKK